MGRFKLNEIRFSSFGAPGLDDRVFILPRAGRKISGAAPSALATRSP